MTTSGSVVLGASSGCRRSGYPAGDGGRESADGASPTPRVMLSPKHRMVTTPSPFRSSRPMPLAVFDPPPPPPPPPHDATNSGSATLPSHRILANFRISIGPGDGGPAEPFSMFGSSP